MPSIDVNIKRGQNVRVDLETFWTDNKQLNNPNNKLLPLDWSEHTSHSSARHPDPETNLFIPLGKNEGGYITFDLSLGHHILAGGTMLSGVGMFRRVALLSLLKSHLPDKLKVILIDPLGLMADFDNIPHLQFPRATSIAEILKTLKWCIEESERRYKLLQENKVSTVWHYNKYKKVTDPTIPSIVIFISELGDLTSIPNFDVTLFNIGSLSRNYDIHIIVTTQQPSIETETPVIKNLISHVIAFQMPYEAESILFIGQGGAEKLLGQGDMLYRDGYNNQTIHMQGLHYPVEQTRDMTNILCRI